MPRSRSDESPRTNLATALLNQAREGNRHALGELLDHFRLGLCSLARQLLSAELAQKVSASDLVQETCIDAMRDFKGAGVDHLRGMEAWLVTLLTNNLIDWQRRFRRRKRDVRREKSLHDQESHTALLDAALYDDHSAQSDAIAEEAREETRKALAELPRGYREIILWRNEERLTWTQIAKRLDRSEDAVRMFWKRAVERLKRRLRQQP